MIKTRRLAISPTSKKLYELAAGASIWTEFAVQPTLGGASCGQMLCGLSDGSIIVNDQAATMMRHFDNATQTWIERGHPGTIAAWNICVPVGTVDAAAVSGSGHVATYTGATTTWALIGNFGGSTVDIAEGGTLTDIWIVHPGAGGECRNWDGAWHTNRATINALGVDASASLDRITRDDAGNIYIAASYSGTGYLIRRTAAGVWSILLSSVGWQPVRGIWAPDGSNVWFTGTDAVGSGDYAWVWDGATATGGSVGSTPWSGAPTKGIHGLDADRVVLHAFGPSVQIHDSGSWVATTYPGADVGQFATLWLPVHNTAYGGKFAEVYSQ